MTIEINYQQLFIVGILLLTEYILVLLAVIGVSNDPYKLSKWEISPAESFTMMDFEYYMGKENSLEQIPDFVTEASVYNGTSLIQEMNMTFSDKVVEESNFPQTEGISITMKMGLSVGIPKVGVSGSIDFSTTSSKTWAYEKKESKEDSRSYSFTIKVPPYKTVKATASVQRYKANVSYVATFKRDDSGKIVKIRGDWSGVSTSSITYRLVEENTGKVLTTFTDKPKGFVDLTKSF